VFERPTVISKIDTSNLEVPGGQFSMLDPDLVSVFVCKCIAFLGGSDFQFLLCEGSVHGAPEKDEKQCRLKMP
jgi:hypothetical protein